MGKKKESAESRALTIASVCLANAGICKRKDPEKCSFWLEPKSVCHICIRRYLLDKARRQLRYEVEVEV